MCTLCDQGRPQNHARSQLGRRDFLKASTAAAAGAGMSLFNAPARAHDDDDQGGPPEDSGHRGRRYVIRGGMVMTMDPSMPNKGEFASADVLVEGKKIVAVGPNLHAGGADEIDARGKIVMPGFIDTHHHQFETALRNFLADGVLINDQTGTPSGSTTYFEFILLTFAPQYKPEDVYISELFGGLSQLDDGVTTVHDVSQIHYSPQHSDAAVQALFDTGRRAAFGYFEGAGQGIIPMPPTYAYPQDARRLHDTFFRSTDQLVTMIMGGEVYIGQPTYTLAWSIGRDLGIPVAAHILSPFGIRPILDALADGTGGNNTITGQPLKIGPDNLFIHMTGMSDKGWKAVHDNGAQVSIAFPIEMNMRHGMPPIVRMQRMGTPQSPFEPSLSTDVEVTLTADFFTQMRSAMNLQRALVNQMILDSPSGNQNLPNPLDWGLPKEPGLVTGGTFPPFWPTAKSVPPIPSDIPAPLTTRDALRYATINGAKALRLDGKTGTLTPGKEADIIILDAQSINVAPLNNVPGAVVSLMDRTNVETVIVAGKIRKWKGRLLGVDLNNLRRKLENSRDGIFSRAGIPQNPFGSQ
jgi:cytosine/adenosine deaminase-related metal-dependent hydrolase